MIIVRWVVLREVCGCMVVKLWERVRLRQRDGRKTIIRLLHFKAMQRR